MIQNASTPETLAASPAPSTFTRPHEIGLTVIIGIVVFAFAYTAWRRWRLRTRAAAGARRTE